MTTLKLQDKPALKVMRVKNCLNSYELRTKSKLAGNLKYIYQPQAVLVYALILKWPFSIVIQLRIEMEKSEKSSIGII